MNIYIMISGKQGKSDGFDSCDQPSDLKLDSNHQFFCPCDREIWWMTIGHLFFTILSFVHHFKAMSEFNLELQSGNAQFGSKSAILCPVWPWNLMDDPEKLQGTSPILLQALCIIS